MAKTPISEVVETVAEVRILRETVSRHEAAIVAILERLEALERKLAELGHIPS